MDFYSGQCHINGEERSNSSTIARLYNAALGKKTQFYVPDSVQHHTRARARSLKVLRLGLFIKVSSADGATGSVTKGDRLGLVQAGFSYAVIAREGFGLAQ